jgi:hypothetical protein
MGDTHLRVLFRGWMNVPHSYAVVNCFQLVHLKKYFGDKVDVYVEEQEYFRSEWNNARKLVYTDEYNDVIKNLHVWSGEEVDIVYSMTYQYDITPVVINGKNVPKCVFFTSEFSWLDKSYFSLYKDLTKYQFGNDSDVSRHLGENTNIHFTSPSLWSNEGLGVFDVENLKERSCVISHGVDTTIFHKTNEDDRNQTRAFYKVKASIYFCFVISFCFLLIPLELNLFASQ